MDNGKEILSEFLSGAKASSFENQEFCRVFICKPLDELKSKPRKAVSVGNHNLLDISFTDGVQ